MLCSRSHSLEVLVSDTKHKWLLSQDLSTPRSLVGGCIECELETECEGVDVRMRVWQGEGCVMMERIRG